MNFLHYIRRIRTLPFHVVAQKVFQKIRRPFHQWNDGAQDFRNPTFLPYLDEGWRLNAYLGSPLSLPNGYPFEALRFVTNQCIKHRFSLLGSGWVENTYGMTCQGIEGIRYQMGKVLEIDSLGLWLENRVNSSNLQHSKKIWKLVGNGYLPIDWQIDCRSGYRWRENQWYREVPFAYAGQKQGVDIRLPWELARLQHLPLLGLAYQAAHQEFAGFQKPSVYLEEFQNEILDFLATNPPRFGVNWACTMEVAIRVANMLVTFDLFRAMGDEFDEDFHQEFIRAVYHHGRHIIENLEWQEEFQSNHFLANVVGLLFVAAFLPCSPEIDAWLAFSIQELIKGVQDQFHSDGSNFEASTSYHRLSAEMVFWGTALVLGLSDTKKAALERFDVSLHRVKPFLQDSPLPQYFYPGDFSEKSPLPHWFFERLEKMAEFTMHLSHPNGEVVQFGDNDSGRFLKLQPEYRDFKDSSKSASEIGNFFGETKSWTQTNFEENVLDHRHLVASAAGLFNRSDFQSFCGMTGVEPCVISYLSGGHLIASFRCDSQKSGAETYRLRLQGTDVMKDEQLRRSPQRESSSSELTLFGYPEHGIFGYRTSRLFLVIRCGSVGQKDNGGHAHNDGLSFELSIDDRKTVVDPGTYVYTPFPEKRNLFRSTRMHNTLSVAGMEQHFQEEGRDGLFQLLPRSQHRILQFDEGGFVGEVAQGKYYHRRTFRVSDTVLYGMDECNFGGSKIIRFHLNPHLSVAVDDNTAKITYGKKGFSVSILGGHGKCEMFDSWYSPGYGVVKASRGVQICSVASSIQWEIIAS